jgi:hypothetical protein
MNAIGAPLVLLSLLVAENKPTPKFPLGSDTTCVTGPLDKDGYIDYESALNRQISLNILPDHNANVLIWKALGPMAESHVPSRYFKWLGIDAPSRKGDYFVTLRRYLIDTLKRSPAQLVVEESQIKTANQRPWSQHEFPAIAGYLRANDKPLNSIVEAVKRPEYFNPLVSRSSERKPGDLSSAFLSNVHRCQEVALALVTRAMMRISDTKFDDAWQDLIACHRLGRLVGRGGLLTEADIGLAIDQVASKADLVYLEKANMNSKQARECLRVLRGLGPLPSIAEKFNLGERYVFLDSLQLVRYAGIGAMEFFTGGPPPQPPDPVLEKILAELDFTFALSSGNRWYDRQTTAWSLKDRTARRKALNAIEEDLRLLEGDNLKDSKFMSPLSNHGQPQPNEADAVTDVLISLTMPNTIVLHDTRDATEQMQRNLQTAFALAAFHADLERYPTKLSELIPSYLPAIPIDLFSDKPIQYSASNGGYKLYSVAGHSEAGQSAHAWPLEDDLRIEIPMPEPKK